MTDADAFHHPTTEITAWREHSAPGAHEASEAFVSAVFADGALPETKQLIAVTFAHITQCPYCITGHTRSRPPQRGHSGGDHGEDLRGRGDARRRSLCAHATLALNTLGGPPPSAPGKQP
ncbi:carboxymuconolactone decarboxylase family protein [Actinacidiphila oryziradicis]|uniref:carboxymuconolactone decarboxylase family protein n=1 Tax=Actinacidiphila oryziradicis TaxID=2571141 RepID=UPI001B805301